MICNKCGQKNAKSRTTCIGCRHPLDSSLGSNTYQVNAREILAFLQEYRKREADEEDQDAALADISEEMTAGYGVETAEIDVVAEVFLSPFRDILKGFRIEKKLGKGGMGVVMAATQLNLNRKVAMKFLPRLRFRVQDVFDRFKREAKTLARLDNPYVVPIYELFESKGHLCIVMGYAEGGSVRDLIKSEGRLREEHAAALAQQTALGLWAASLEGIVHRDIKPGNLLLCKNGRVRIADFGLAKQLDESTRLTHDGSILGTPAYISPEQWSGEGNPDHRSDLYSLGCTLYEMLAGTRPFETKARHEMIKQHIMDTPPDVRDSRPEISEAMATIVARLLEKDPDKRFQTGVELAEALEPLAAPYKRRQRVKSSDEVALEAPAPVQEPVLAAAAPAGFLASGRGTLISLLCIIAFLVAERLYQQPADTQARGEDGNTAVALAFDLQDAAERAAERWEDLQERCGFEDTAASLEGAALLAEGRQQMRSGAFEQAIDTYLRADRLFDQVHAEAGEERLRLLEDSLRLTSGAE